MPSWETYADNAQLVRSSGFFLRLARKTQIYTPRGNPHTRMRMSHTTDVLAFSQRVISGLGEDTLHTLDAGLGAWSVHESLKEHLWLASAIALAHAVGHTPFGHAGEEALQHTLRCAEFHHNWQSVRVLERVEQAQCAYGSHDDGMGLSLETLDGVLNHTRRPECPKPVGPAWLGRQRGDAGLFSSGVPRTVAGLAVAVADEAAQRVSDISDGLREKTLRPNALRGHLPDRSREILTKLDAIARDGDGEGRHRESIARLELQATLTKEYLDAVIGLWSARPQKAVEVALAGREAKGKDEYCDAMRGLLGDMAGSDKALQGLVELALHKHQDVRRANRIGEKVIGDLAFACIEKPWLMMDWYWERWQGEDPSDECARHRHIADYLAAMTDDQAIEKHREYFGSSYR